MLSSIVLSPRNAHISRIRVPGKARSGSLLERPPFPAPRPRRQGLLRIAPSTVSSCLSHVPRQSFRKRSMPPTVVRDLQAASRRPTKSGTLGKRALPRPGPGVAPATGPPPEDTGLAPSRSSALSCPRPPAERVLCVRRSGCNGSSGLCRAVVAFARLQPPGTAPRAMHHARRAERVGRISFVVISLRGDPCASCDLRRGRGDSLPKSADCENIGTCFFEPTFCSGALRRSWPCTGQGRCQHVCIATVLPI